MTSLLRPYQAVKCPYPEFKPETIVLVSKCENCEHCIEIRRPWRGWIVKSELEIREELQKLEKFVAQVVDGELKERYTHYIDQLEWVLKEVGENE